METNAPGVYAAMTAVAGTRRPGRETQVAKLRGDGT